MRGAVVVEVVLMTSVLGVEFLRGSFAVDVWFFVFNGVCGRL